MIVMLSASILMRNAFPSGVVCRGLMKSSGMNLTWDGRLEVAFSAFKGNRVRIKEALK